MERELGICSECHWIYGEHAQDCSTREPTFTLAQVKEIIEGIAVRVEKLEVNYESNYCDDECRCNTTVSQESTMTRVAKLIRETEI